jgi:protein-S-isoprenylcysteine O-methyltransferase Ste14
VSLPARAALLLFGAAAYAAFLLSVAAAVDFITGAGLVFRGIDSPPVAPLPNAIAIDVALLALFGVSHSVMARDGFKRRWTKLVPPAAERSVYVLTTGVCLALTFWQWRALPQPIWNATGGAARVAVWTLTAVGGVLAIWSTFLTNHFDLFGLRQVWLAARGRPYTPVAFEQHAIYRVVRHPMMLGILLAFWATPTLTAGHALFAAGMSAYIAIGIRFEERGLERRFGDDYRRYRREVPAVLPFSRRASSARSAGAPTA